MKILAIRGENLASLAGKFELCFERAPLKDAGLFAITGRTGAGKSTVLDALCLALYDKIPRLAQHTEGVPVGREGDEDSLLVKSNDVRSILRKGAAYGAAEVEFIGSDKHRYLARWEVRKARNKVTGKLQPQTITFINQDTGQPIGQNRTDIKQAIEERIGLTFDQFRRSVLLAQGDFAAFLKAKHDERSSLLERITGTEIYSRLSIAAHQRARDELLRLNQLKTQLNEQLPLPLEQRDELEQQAGQLLEVFTQGQQHIKTAQAVIDWYRTLAGLIREQNLAGEDLAKARLSWESTQQERQLLIQVEACQPLRPLLENWRQVQRDHEQANRSLEEAKQLQLQAQDLQARLQRQLEESQRALAAAEQNQQQAQPQLKQARELDTRLHLAEAELAGSEKQLAELMVQSEGFERKHKILLRQLDLHRGELAQQQDWREQHLQYQPIADHWQHWQAELNRYRQQGAELGQCSKEFEQINRQIDRQEQTFLHACSQRDSTAEETSGLSERLRQLRQQSESIPLHELSRQRSLLDERIPVIQQALTLFGDAERTQTRLKQNRAESIELDQLMRDTQSAIHQSEQAQINQQAVLAEAKRALQLALATRQQTAEQLRALLTAGQHCPVCGATEHPWQSPSDIVALQADAQQQRVNELEHEAGVLLVRLAEARHKLDSAATRKQQLAGLIGEDEALLDSLHSAWDALAWLDKPSDLDDENAKSRIELLQASVTAERNRIGVQEQQALALQSQAHETQQHIEKLQAVAQASNKRIGALENELTRLRAEQKNMRNKIELCQEQLQNAGAVLAEPLAGIEHWRQRLADDPERFIEQCAVWVVQWQQHEQRLKQLDKALETGAAEERLVSQQLAQAEQLRRDKSEQTAAQRERHEQLRRERSTLFSGKSADQIEQELALASSTKKQSYEQALAGFNAAVQGFIKAEQAVSHGEAVLHGLSGQVMKAGQKLETALAERSLSRAQLDGLLQYDGVWMDQQKKHFDELRQARVRCEEKLKLCTENRGRHEDGKPEIELVAAEQDLQDLQQRQQTVSEQMQAKRFELKRDDERKHACSQLQQELAAQENTWKQWACLDELIGSANGQKFRKFAQSLTLDALLGQANQHLQDFARRYQLQRTPGSDLELQVIDTDMGDEVRSVHSLSGGESFLVSLALALGLSSLAATTTPVESLFIDEGFGSLDQETLDVAMASLDTLQAMGRKVGVISHVPIMVEDIAVQVVVEKQGGGGSRVLIKG